MHLQASGGAGEASESRGEDAELDSLVYVPVTAVPATSDEAVAIPVEYTAGLDDVTLTSLKSHCKYCRGFGDKGLFTDWQLRHEGIYLHALQYEVNKVMII